MSNDMFLDSMLKNKEVDSDIFMESMIKTPKVKTDVSDDIWSSTRHPENKYSGMIKDASDKYGVPYGVLYELLDTETKFNPNLVSDRGAQGIAQFMPGTAKEMGVDPFDPKSAIPGAARYLIKLQGQLRKDGYSEDKIERLSVAAYNAGRGNVLKYKGVPPFKETQNYVKSVYQEPFTRKGKDKVRPPLKSKPSVMPEVFDDDAMMNSMLSTKPSEEDMPKAIIKSPIDKKGITKEFYSGLADVDIESEVDNRPFGGVLSISKDNSKPSFITRAVDSVSKLLGMDVRSKLSNRAKAQAVVQLMANEEGVSLSEYRQSPELIEKAASSFVDMATLGVIPAIKDSMTGEVDYEATDVPGYIGSALGSLGGLFIGPLPIANKVMSPIVKYLPRATQEGKLAARIMKEALHDAVVLGPAMGLSQLGEAAKSVTFGQAAEHIWEGTKSGALTGAIFGATRGMFPKDVSQRAARVVTGLVGLNALRAMEGGGNPFVNRPVGEVLFDIGLDTLFMWRGLPKGLSKEVFSEVENLSKESADIKQKEDLIKNIPDEATKQMNLKMLEMEKIQAKLKAEELSKKVQQYSLVMGEMAMQNDRIAMEKLRPVQGRASERFVSKKGNEYRKIDDVWVDEGGQKVTNNFKLKAIERGMEKKANDKKVLDDPITAAAIKLKDGEIVPGEIHADAYNIASEAGKNVKNVETGYVTKSGKFLSNKEAKELVKVDETNKIMEAQAKIQDEVIKPNRSKIKRTDNTPTHGTDIDALEEILGEGLNPGSAVDFGKKNEWAGEYPIQVEVPDAVKGEYVEHNKYHTTAYESNATKVIVDLDAYTSEGASGVLKKVNKLKKEYPNVEFEINGKSPKSDALTTDNIVRIYREEYELDLKDAKEQAKIDKQVGTVKLYEDTTGKRVRNISDYKEMLEHYSKEIEPEVTMSDVEKRAEEIRARREEIEFSAKETAKLEAELAENKAKIDKANADKGKAQDKAEDPNTTRKENDKLRERDSELDTKINQLEVDREGIIEQIEAHKPEPITEVDTATGTKTPGLEGKKSPFYQDPVKSAEMAEAYKGREKAISESPEMFTQKVINDVNRWFNKQGEVDIAGARNGLSELAARADELASSDSFVKQDDFLRWKKTVEEAAEWARRLDRTEIKRSVEKELTMEEKIAKITGALEKDIGKGITLTSGVDPTIIVDVIKGLFKGNKPKDIDIKKFPKGERAFIQNAVDYRDAFLADMEASKELKKISKGKVKQNIAEAVWDTKSYARKALIEGSKDGTLGKNAEVARQRMINEAGGNGFAHVMYNQFRKEITNGLNKNKLRILYQLIRGRRIQDLAGYKASIKFPEGQGWENTIPYEYKFGELEGLTPKESADMMRRVEAYFEGMKRLVDVGVEAGTISGEASEWLKSHDYSRFKGIGQRLEKGEGGAIEDLYDHRYKTRVGGKVTSVTSSGIESLKRGKKTDILEADQMLVALEMFNRTYGRAFTNRTFSALADMAKDRPGNPYVRLGKKETPKDQPGLGDSRHWDRHHYFENGVKKVIYIEPDFAKGLSVAGRDLSPRAIELAKWTTFSTIAKMGHTGIAPLWSTFVNLPLDIFHSMMTSGVYESGKFKPLYSKNAAIIPLQMGRDFSSTFYDTFFRAWNQKEKIKYMRTAERGMLMPFLSSQGRLTGTGYTLPGKLAKFENFMTYYSNSLELWTRQSIAERVIRNRGREQGIGIKEARKSNKIVDEAVTAARDYLDFSQGGWAVKMKDQLGWIYLNAATQVLRTEIRSAKEAPVAFISKSAQTIAVPAIMATAAAMMLAPRTKTSVPSYMDESNLVIPFPDSFIFKDNEGQEFGLVMTMPLGTGSAFIKNITQALTEKFMYESGLTNEEPNYKSIVGSLTKMAPDLMTLPPAQRALVEYALNIDFWTRRQKVPNSFSWPKSKEEFVPGDTPQIGIDIGKVTKLSPERLDMVRKNIIGNNIWTYAMGKGYEEAFSDVPKEMREEHLALTLAQIPGINRFIKVVRLGGERREPQKEYKEEDKFNRFVDSRNIDYYAKMGYWHGTKEGRSKIREYLREPRIRKDQGTYDRLYDRVEFIRSIKDLKERGTWSSLWYSSSKVKAQDYLDRREAAVTPEEKKRFRRQMAIIHGAKGYISEDFWNEVVKEKRVRRETNLSQ